MTSKAEEANGGPQELETFLPQDNSSINGVTKYKLNKANELEAGSSDYDIFKGRDEQTSTTDLQTLTHLLKSALGTGILSMPVAFRNSGLILGVIGTVGVSLIVAHCCYILVECAHELYKRTGKNLMGFADVGEYSCLHGPKWAKSFSKFLRYVILISIFITYFTTCSCYAVIVASNFNHVIDHYMQTHINIRLTLAILLLPCMVLVYIPNLKSLTPVSMIANAFMAIGLGITLYYLVIDLPPLSERTLFADISTFPVFFSITLFAVECIGVVMPLENNMKSPKHLLGVCGVLHQGISAITLIYILIGFFGYLKYGDATAGVVTLNLPKDAIPAQAVNILIGLAVLCTFGLQFYVALDIVWIEIKDKFTERPMLANYIIRTVMVVTAIGIAIAVPAINPFVSLIGAFCFSILGLIVPIIMEIFTFWDRGFGFCFWRLIKDVIVVIAGVTALIFGSKSAIEDIITLYK